MADADLVISRWRYRDLRGDIRDIEYGISKEGLMHRRYREWMVVVGTVMSLSSAMAVSDQSELQRVLEEAAEKTSSDPAFNEKHSDKAFFEAFISRLKEAVSGPSVSQQVGMGPYVIIPDGRSLQKNHADFVHPRYVGVIEDPSGAGQPLPRYFVGYASHARQAEALAWQFETGQFVPLVITDFAPGSKPKVEKADRQVCLKCHQNNLAPIFSTAPWAEVFDINKMNRERQRIGLSPFSESLLMPPFVYDGAVRGANTLTQVARMCREVCRDSADKMTCQKSLLLAGVAVPTATSQMRRDIEKKLLNFAASEFSKAWPRHGFVYPSSVIPDRDPLQSVPSFLKWEVVDRPAASVFLDTHGDMSPLLPRGAGYYIRNTQDILFAESLTQFSVQSGIAVDGLRVKKVEGQEAEILMDPRTPRPEVSYLTPQRAVLEMSRFLATSCLNMKREEMARLTKIPVARLANLIMKSPGLEQELKEWPRVSTVNLLRILENEPGPVANAEALDSIIFGQNLGNSLGESSGSSGGAVSPAIVMNFMDTARVKQLLMGGSRMTTQGFRAAFTKYCSSCHVEDDPSFMAPKIHLETADQWNKWAHRMKANLQSFKMPDTGFGEVPLPSDWERASMIDYLSSLRD